MKYLFITNDIGYQDNANSNIVFAICDELQKNHNEVHMFSVSQFIEKKEHNYRKYPVFCFGPQIGIFRYSNQYNGYRDIFKLIPLIFKPLLWGAAIRVLLSRINAEKSISIESFFAVLRIRLLNKRHKYDRIIAVCEPGMSINIASRLRNAHISIYQLDPFHSSKTKQLRLKNWRLKIEASAYKNAEFIYLTKLIQDEYNYTKLAKFATKWTIVDFPLIRQYVKSESKPAIHFTNDKINCLYCGTLDTDYRNPKFALELARNLSDDYRFYFVGRNCVEIIQNTMRLTDHRIVTSSILPIEETYQLMASADFLVNIGNTMTNQMPSKIIDYISTGKPIINIVKSRDCPTLDYIARYPIAISIFEEANIDINLINAVEKFCRENKGNSFPYSDIRRLYYEATPEYVADLIAHPNTSSARMEKGYL